METQNTKTREQIYLDFLIDLKSMLEVTQFVSVAKLANKHGITQNVTMALQRGNIIKNNGGRSRGARWEWSTKVNPNLHMAAELINRSSMIKKEYDESYVSMSVKEKVVKKRQPRIKKVEAPVSKSKSISILWGLIKIQS